MNDDCFDENDFFTLMHRVFRIQNEAMDRTYYSEDDKALLKTLLASLPAKAEDLKRQGPLFTCSSIGNLFPPLVSSLVSLTNINDEDPTVGKAVGEFLGELFKIFPGHTSAIELGIIRAYQQHSSTKQSHLFWKKEPYETSRDANMYALMEALSEKLGQESPINADDIISMAITHPRNPTVPSLFDSPQNAIDTFVWNGKEAFARSMDKRMEQFISNETLPATKALSKTVAANPDSIIHALNTLSLSYSIATSTNDIVSCKIADKLFETIIDTLGKKEVFDLLDTKLTEATQENDDARQRLIESSTRHFRSTVSRLTL